MLETIKISQFLKTGNFGSFDEIYFGMTRDTFLNVLGEIEDVQFSSKKSKFPSVYYCSDIEFYIEDDKAGRLHGIQIQTPFGQETSSNLKVEYGIFESELNFDFISNQLRKENISFEILKLEYDSDDTKRIKTEGGVQLIFSEDDKGLFLLCSISKFVRLSDDSPREKQIGFSIPADIYEEIKQRAEEEKISVAQMCRKMILEEMKKHKGND